MAWLPPWVGCNSGELSRLCLTASLQIPSAVPALVLLSNLENPSLGFIALPWLAAQTTSIPSKVEAVLGSMCHPFPHALNLLAFEPWCDSQDKPFRRSVVL